MNENLDNQPSPNPSNPAQSPSPRTGTPQFPSQASSPLPAPAELQAPQPSLASFQVQPHDAKPSRHRMWFIVGGIGLVVVIITIGLLIVSKSFPFAGDNTPLGDASLSQIDVGDLEKAYDTLYKSGVKEFSPQKKSSIIGAFKDLSTGLSIDEDFYTHVSNNLIGLGIAALYSEDKAHKDIYKNELYLLAVNNLDAVPPGIEDAYFQNKAKQQENIKLFNKYKDAPLTAALENAVKSSKLSESVAKNLHIDTLAEPINIVALNFDNVSPQQQQFAKEHYMYGAQPTMWAEEVGGIIYILVTKNFANDFIQNPQGTTRNKLMHELVHTQKPFSRGELGRSIEERRAELLSGDMSVYYDAKQMFVYVEIFSGFGMLDSLRKHPLDADAFYLSLYTNLGVSAANHVLASWPSAYLSSPSVAQKKVYQFTDNMDGVIKASLARTDSTDNMKVRIQARYEKLLGILNTKDKVIHDLDSNLAQAYGMPTAATYMKSYINSL